MTHPLDDLHALATYLQDVRAALESFDEGVPEERLRAETLAAPLAEIQRFVVAVSGRVDRVIAAQGTALRSSRGRYNALVDHLPVAIFVDRNDRIAQVNAACVALLGATSSSQLIGRSPFDFVPAEDREVAAARMASLRVDRAPVLSVAQRFLRLDGTVVETELDASAFDDGGARSIHVALRDVTAQRRSEARIAQLNAMLEGVRRVNRLVTRERDPDALLRKSAEILVQAGGLASATVFLSDPFGTRLVTAVGSAERAGRLAQVVEKVGPPACVARAARGELVRIQDPTATCLDCPARSTAAPCRDVVCLPLMSDGRTFGVLHAVLPIGVGLDGEDVGILSELVTDIAFALRAIDLEGQVGRTAESLQAIGERFSALVAVSPTAIVTFDPGGCITSWNRGAEELFGWTEREALGSVGPFGDLGMAAVARTLDAQLHATRRVVPRDATVRRKDGAQVEVSFTAIALRAPDEAARGLVCVFVDVTARKRAERALRESAEQYRTEFEHAAAGRCLSTPDGRILRVNPALAALLGHAAEDLSGRAVEELIHPDDLEGSRELGLRLLAGEEDSFRAEMRFLRADGGVVWCDLSTSLYRGAGGEPVHFITDVQDLTARKAAEAQSLRQGARLEALARVARALASARTVEAVGAIVPRAARELVDADGANFCVRAGDECREVAEEAMTGLYKGRARTAGRCVARWVLEHGAQACIEDVFADPRVDRGELFETFIQSLVTTPVAGASPGAAIGVFWASRHAPAQDELEVLSALADSVSVALQNVESDALLRRSEDRHRKLIDSLDDLVYAVDAEGRISYVSPAVARYGYAPAELLGHRFQEFAHPDDRAALQEAFAARLSTDVGPYEFRVFDAAGKVRIVRSSGRRILDDGRLLGLAGVLIDLTAQRSTEEQLRAAQKMEAIGRLAGGVAHDFNNLLTVINSYARLAARGLEPGDRRREELGEIQRAGERAAALTRQLLAFSRRQVLQPTVVDVNGLVAGMERMLARLIGEDVRLRVVPDAAAGRIRADAGQVEQVLMNLAVNARDAMPNGGELAIEAASVELDDAFVQRHVGARRGSFVRVRARDTGCGMDAATRDRLFEPFFTTKPAGKGTGLGLATVYGIVQQSGGSIFVESEPGRGATFDVYFPRVETSPEAPAAPSSGAQARGEGTILFVEDDESIRALAGHVLDDEGFRVHLAANGGEALVLAERHGRQIDLVVTDVVMPGMSGKELAERLQPHLRGTPILFMSGYGHDVIAQQGALDPGTLFLPKPFTPETLVARVREVLRQLG